MKKTTKFTISVPAAEFKEIEASRRKSGRSRSQFIRDAVRAWKPLPQEMGVVREARSLYSPSPEPVWDGLTDIEERRKRAIAAAGRFHSGSNDLGESHDRHLEEAYGEAPENKEEPAGRKR